MTTTASAPPADHSLSPAGRGALVLEVVVPVHNEQATLERSVRRLHRYLNESFPLTWRITIADSGSSDATWPIAVGLADELAGVRTVRLAQKGRGRALREAWQSSDAAVLAYMDVDLSTDLAALLPLVAPLVSGHSDLAIGTRLGRGARVVRGPKREVISRCYNAILRTSLGAGFSDAQCGFKAIRRDRAEMILPLVMDQSWFFDTELLVLAERAGLRIHEVPVDWTEDPHSTVDLAATAVADLRGVARLMHSPGLFRQLSRFAVIGVLSTAAYLGLYVALRGELGAFGANALALALTTVANTAANRRLTFGIAGREGALRHQLQGAGVFAAALAVTSAALVALHAAQPHPFRSLELAVLVIANLVATGLRFVLLRHWVFRVAALRSAS
ncbi:MAG TPA: bifunctional glycosyltransferase family 2/GtrA family protein [Mycobacteriales bacterium]|jgi:putative flippase GtrA|nr:bifunctional glycosyltransferase family 2/GtrA family protein [Mycobacteriales bacterium]